MPEKEIAAKAAEMLVNGWLASIWGAAHNLHRVYRGEPFRTVKFVLNMALAAFVWILVISFVPTDYQYRDSIIFLSGFSALPILDFLENGGWMYIVNIFLRAFRLKEIDFPKNDWVDTQRDAR